MTKFKEFYRRYSLFVLIVGIGITLFVVVRPFLGGLLGAATIYVLLRGQLFRLTQRHNWRRSRTAALLVTEAFILFLIPISGIVWLVVSKMQQIIADPETFFAPVRALSESIRMRTSYDLLDEVNITALMASLPRMGQQIVGAIVHFGFNVVILLFVLYFMLIGGRRMEDYSRGLLPFDPDTTQIILHEVRRIVQSNAIGIPLIALIQGGVAYIGYQIFGAPDPVFWGLLTCIATVVPVFGAAIVWGPVSLYLLTLNRWGAAIGLMTFGLVVITHVDNVVRFVMQRKLADTHPLVTIIGVLIGLSLFGFVGVIFGPLLLSLFIYFVHIFKVRYLDDRAELLPGEPNRG